MQDRPRLAASSSHPWWASASRLHTPNTGMPRANANVLAVTRPIRSPVKGAGPVPATTALTSAGVRPARSRTSAIPGARYSACRRASRVLDSASTRSPSWSATVMAEVAVSIASSSTGSGYRDELVQQRAGVLVCPPPAMAGHVHRPGVVPAQRHLEVVLAELLGHSATPLDHGDHLFERGVQIEVIELGEATEPVGVNMNE